MLFTTTRGIIDLLKKEEEWEVSEKGGWGVCRNSTQKNSRRLLIWEIEKKDIDLDPEGGCEDDEIINILWWQDRR